MTFASTSDVLDRLAPAHEFAPDWNDVLARAGLSPGTTHAPTRRRLVLVAVLFVAIAAPLTAIAESHDWWFFSSGAPAPATDVVVVRTGEWGGRPWELVAYRTVNDGLCFSLAPLGSQGRGAMNCDQLVGVTPASGQVTPRAITYLVGRPTKELPPYVVGAVVEQAAAVVIYSSDGELLRTPTFAASAALGPIRFYAAPLPPLPFPQALTSVFLDKLVGLDGEGRVVACLNVPLPPADAAPRFPCP